MTGPGKGQSKGQSKGPTAGQVVRLDVDALIDDPQLRVLVCCGAGGVSKTTTAAALGLRAAERGRRVVVLTIDPARRLAQSLGLTELDNVPRPIEGIRPVEGTRPAGRTKKHGRLDAMMLDMKRTFDEVIESHASPEKAAQILANPFYIALSSSFAGTQEYMAMEKLGQLRAQAEADPDGWDLIVVDTPPSRSALDFLDAPARLGSFLDGRLVRVLAAPAKAGGRAYLRVMSAAVGGATSVMSKVLGGQVLRDVQSFVAALDTVFGGFRERAQHTYELLQAPDTAFVVVATPEPDALREAAFFVERLAQERMPLAGLVVNRVHVPLADGLSGERAAAAAEELEPDGEHAVTAGLLRIHAGGMRRRDRERALTLRFTGAHPEIPLVEVAARAQDVHDLEALRGIGDSLASR